MKYLVSELIDNAFVLKNTFKEDELDKAMNFLNSLNGGQLEEVTNLGSRIVDVKEFTASNG